MQLDVKKTLSAEETELGLKRITIDGYISQTMVVFTSGPFLIAFSLLLGATNFIIGLLAALPQIFQMIRIPTIKFVNKIGNRRKITIFSLIFYRSSLFLIALIPFFFSLNMGMGLLLIFLSTQAFSSAIAQTAWSSWMHDLIPRDRLGAFYSKRMMLSTLMAMISSLAGALFIEIWNMTYVSNNQIYAYSALFIIGFIFGLVSLYIISGIPEPELLKFERSIKFRKIISEPFKDLNHRNLMIFLIIWNFALYLSSPFYVVYMIERLQFDIFLIILITVYSQILNLIFFNIWGKIIDKFSNKAVLIFCCPLYLFSIFLWPFTTLPERYILSIPLILLIHTLIGLSMAGILLALGNINLKLTPKGLGNTYLNITIIFTSISLGIAPILGGLLSDIFKEFEFSWTFQFSSSINLFSFQALNLQGLDFIFLLAFIIGLFSLYQLALVKEEGEINKKVIIHEFIFEIRRTMRNIMISKGYLDLISSQVFLKRRLNTFRKEKNSHPKGKLP